MKILKIVCLIYFAFLSTQSMGMEDHANSIITLGVEVELTNAGTKRTKDDDILRIAENPAKINFFRDGITGKQYNDEDGRSKSYGVPEFATVGGLSSNQLITAAEIIQERIDSLKKNEPDKQNEMFKVDFFNKENAPRIGIHLTAMFPINQFNNVLKKYIRNFDGSVVDKSIVIAKAITESDQESLKMFDLTTPNVWKSNAFKEFKSMPEGTFKKGFLSLFFTTVASIFVEDSRGNYDKICLKNQQVTPLLKEESFFMDLYLANGNDNGVKSKLYFLPKRELYQLLERHADKEEAKEIKEFLSAFKKEMEPYEYALYSVMNIKLGRDGRSTVRDSNLHPEKGSILCCDNKSLGRTLNNFMDSLIKVQPFTPFTPEYLMTSQSDDKSQQSFVEFRGFKESEYNNLNELCGSFVNIF